MVKVIILRTGGTNCDLETEWACQVAGASTSRIHISQITTGRVKILDFDILIIPGGFSYGDDLGAGKVLANEIMLKCWEQIEKFREKQRPIIGICNGFQVLVKAKMLPFWGKHTASLVWNESGRFEDRWVNLRVEKSTSPFFNNMPEIIRFPVAHAEGKFVLKSHSLLKKIEKNQQVILRYVNPSGETQGYPYNPNGSIAGIAGVCDEKGLVIGMMPHPERALLRIHLPDWTRLKGQEEFSYGYRFFKNVIEYCS
ncbi:MAG TPA: phosphoribosylformylglycinamidine synthase I [bacterium]|nr:phosphoribosylformylglycinamidine synthase I [bacterium]HOL35175.1 phosphoribosylformylglycinamidine synthase I [bacterium]HPP09043.1 phosphoribosylformylglycinamidine synthase I [bacterium]